jgi:hypothetical protein
LDAIFSIEDVETSNWRLDLKKEIFWIEQDIKMTERKIINSFTGEPNLDSLLMDEELIFTIDHSMQKATIYKQKITQKEA